MSIAFSESPLQPLINARSPAPRAAEESLAPDAAGRISSELLFAGHKEIEIQHGEAVYRLRHTQSGKLILTK